MKLAVLADIHSNLAALETVLSEVHARDPDQVIVAGDVVNRGPLPARCLEIVLDQQTRNGWHVLRGNHEDFVLRAAETNGDMPEWEKEVCRHSHWTCARLGPRLEALRQMPHCIDVPGPDGQTIRAVHASMAGNRHGLYRRMTDAEMLALIAPQPGVMCVGHTHVPFVRRLGATLVVNAGAVGLPFDRDYRAAYAWLEWANDAWAADIVRLPYDSQATREAFFATGYYEEGGPMVRLILDELENARPRLRQWHDEYESQVAGGTLSVAESVEALLRRP
jgi:predicted phosphodiesterase